MLEFESISEASRYGMNVERARLEIASHKLAMANIPFSSSIEAMESAEKSMQQINNSFLKLGEDFSQKAIGTKSIHDEDNPMADKDGYVHYFDVDPILEITALVTAIRAYQANVRAYNTNGEMNSSALRIGGAGS